MSALDWYHQQGLGRPQTTRIPTPPVFTPAPRRELPGGPPVGQQTVTGSLQYWRGSAEAQADTGRCPACGSPNFIAQIKSDQGKLSMGHCMACSYRGDHSVLSGPSMQSQVSLRGLDAGVIPTKQARQARQPKGSGGFSVIAHIKA